MPTPASAHILAPKEQVSAPHSPKQPAEGANNAANDTFASNVFDKAQNDQAPVPSGGIDKAPVSISRLENFVRNELLGAVELPQGKRAKLEALLTSSSRKEDTHRKE